MGLGILEWFPNTIGFLILIGFIFFVVFLIKRKKFFEFFANPKTSIWIDKSKWEDEQLDNKKDEREDKESSD